MCVCVCESDRERAIERESTKYLIIWKKKKYKNHEHRKAIFHYSKLHDHSKYIIFIIQYLLETLLIYVWTCHEVTQSNLPTELKPNEQQFSQKKLDSINYE